MEEREKKYSDTEIRIDGYSMLTDVLKNLWAVFLGALAAAMIVTMISQANFSTTYTANATFVITTKQAGTYTQSNLSAAQVMAEAFSNVLNSALLKKEVCRDLNISEFDATATASVIDETNLMTLTVTAATPERAYKITQSIIKNYANLTQYVSDNMIMQVLQQPGVPEYPDQMLSASSRAKKVFAGTFVLLIVCFMALSWQHDTIKSEADLNDKLDARDLGMIYHEKKRPGKKKNLLIGSGRVGFEFNERFRKIAAITASTARQNKAKTILVTSVEEGEGKTTVAANLAMTLGRQDYKVALVEGNLIDPGLYRIFDMAVDPSMSVSAVLAGYAKKILFLEDKNLHLVLDAERHKNSADLVSSTQFINLIKILRESMDYVIIDTPAMSSSSDAEAIADYADMSLLVVGYNRTDSGDLNDAADALRDCSASFGGCILNEVRTLPGGRRATAGYGSYGRYGRYGHYGHYGRYGNYGHYGRYGRYYNADAADVSKRSSAANDGKEAGV